MALYKTHKSVLQFENNSREFLNGLTANDMSAPRNAFVTIHGKIVAVCDQVNIDEEEHWLVVENEYLMPLLDHLDKFIKLSGIKVTPLQKNVYWDLFGDVEVDEGVYIPQKCGRLILTDSDLEANVDEEAFLKFRIENEIPLEGLDYSNDFLLNVDMTSLVSFTKGCYLGQEPISKVYNRSKPTWKLTVQNLNDVSDEMKEKATSKFTNSETGITKGFLFIKNDG